MHHRLPFTIILYLLLASMPASSESSTESDIYFNHLKYEYGNRARTFIGMGVAAEASKYSERGSFFQAYYELEKLNQKIYGHTKEELGVDYQVNWIVRTGLKMVAYIGWRLLNPQWFVDIVIPYLPKLEEMQSLSDPKHHLFFDYVVAQEEVQLTASQAVVDGDWQDGADVILAFLPHASKVLAQLSAPPD
ncbi:MAG: hypothetical protein ACR2P1_06645 [Pseudomonadales bacterium]